MYELTRRINGLLHRRKVSSGYLLSKLYPVVISGFLRGQRRPRSDCAVRICSNTRFHIVRLIAFWAQFITKTRLFNYIGKFITKKWKFSDKKFWYFSYICSKHRLWVLVEPPRRGGSNEYLQSMVFSRNKKNNVYPCKPQFYYIKVGFKGVKII